MSNIEELRLYKTTHKVNKLSLVKGIKDISGRQIGLKESKHIADSVCANKESNYGDYKIVEMQTVKYDRNLLSESDFYSAIKYLDDSGITYQINNRVSKIANIYPKETFMLCIDKMGLEQLKEVEKILKNKIKDIENGNEI